MQLHTKASETKRKVVIINTFDGGFRKQRWADPQMWPLLNNNGPPALWLEQSGWKVLDRCGLFTLLIGGKWGSV